MQREGEVVHVVVSKCVDLTKLLGKLVQRGQEEPPVLTLSRADEKSAPYPSQNKRITVPGEVSKDIFYGGRNFK